MSTVRNVSGGPLELASGRIIPPTGPGVPDVTGIDVSTGHNQALAAGGLLHVVVDSGPIPVGPQVVAVHALIDDLSDGESLRYDDDAGYYINAPPFNVPGELFGDDPANIPPDARVVFDEATEKLKWQHPGKLFDPRDEGTGAAWNGTADDHSYLMATLERADAAGGDMVLPPGIGRFSDEIVLPFRNDGVLRRTVGIVSAAGRGAAQLKALTDFGAGKFAIRPENPLDEGGVLRGFTVKSSSGAYVPGTPPVQMDGIQVGIGWSLEDVISLKFYGGIVPRGHHNSYRGVESSGHYSVLFRLTAGAQGDNTFYDCTLSGNTCASIGVLGGAQPGGMTMFRGHVGFGPYVVFIPEGEFTTIESVIAGGIHFYGTSFEALGNGIFRDECRGLASKLTLKNCENFQLNNTYQWAAKGRGALIYGGTLDRWEFEGCEIASNLYCDQIFDATVMQDFTFGALSDDKFIQPYLTAGKKIGTVASTISRVRTPRGELLRAQLAVTANRLVEVQGIERCQPNTDPTRYVGVAQNDAASGELAYVVQPKKHTRVSIESSTAIPSGGRVAIDATDPTKVRAVTGLIGPLIVGKINNPLTEPGVVVVSGLEETGQVPAPDDDTKWLRGDGWAHLPTNLDGPVFSPKVGGIYSAPGTRSSLSRPDGTLSGAPLFWPACTIDSLGIEVTAAIAATSIRLGFYEVVNGELGDCLAEAPGTVDASSTGVKPFLVLTTPLALPGGWFVAAGVPQGGAPSCRGLSPGVAVPGAPNVNAGGLGGAGWSRANVFGALPATLAGLAAPTDAAWIVTATVLSIP